MINFIIALNGEEGIDDRCLCTNHAFNILWMNTRDFEPSDTRGPDPTEIMMAPLFVNPNGPDDMLGSVHGADDDFRYQQTAAGDLQNSPAVKAGSASVAHLGLDDKTTRSDNVPDRGRVDIGYHYRIAGVAQMLPVPPEDLDTEIKALCTRLHTFVNNINGWIGEGLLDSESGRSWIETTHRLQDKLACILE